MSRQITVDAFSQKRAYLSCFRYLVRRSQCGLLSKVGVK